MINNWLKNTQNWFQKYAFCCYLCHDNTTSDQLICDLCWRDLMTDDDGQVCDGLPEDVIDYSLSLSGYRFPLDRLLLSLKYREKIILARELGSRLASKVRQADLTLPDCIVPVPLHPGRLMLRGFNQALEISRQLSRELQIPLRYRGIRRKRWTRPQFQLKRHERRDNMKDAFQVTALPPASSVVIVDDIVTTGETARELARVLRSAGASEVGLWTCARADSAENSGIEVFH